MPTDQKPNPIDKLIRFCLENKLVVVLFTAGMMLWGVMVAPFDWQLDFLPRDPIPVDAIPDIGENQQIVFTNWSGHSPQDIEDQITYPLTTALLGLPQVKSIRSYSLFGFSSIYIIFDENADFYWTRTRILEKLNSLPQNTLPTNAIPQLGPDATGLGQVFWYTLENDAILSPSSASETLSKRSASNGLSVSPSPWPLHELRSIQDWQVRFALQSVPGVAEVSSIGGHVKEYQVDLDPDALRSYGLSIQQVFKAVQASNIDAGARTIEINAVEYFIRGLGTIQRIEDLRNTVITERNHTPITLDQVAQIELGPATRRGVLDKSGAEAVGGVVVARYGENPLQVINRIKEKIAEISPGLPRKTLADGTVSQVTIVPFYDRSILINETLGTLENTVRQQILVTLIVILLMLLNLRSAFLVSSVLPIAVLFSFVGMKLFKIDANIVSLSGIAIAIGTIVDVGIVLTENILKHLEKADNSQIAGRDTPSSRTAQQNLAIIYKATTEVSGALTTAVLTTIISFLPIFTMVAAEGKLFRPLAFTKTFALFASILIALTLIPALAHLLFRKRKKRPASDHTAPKRLLCIGIALGVSFLLSKDWTPFGPDHPLTNFLFIIASIGLVVFGLNLFAKAYPTLLRHVLHRRRYALAGASTFILWGIVIWFGFNAFFAWTPQWLQRSSPFAAAERAFPGLGEEFMPALDEGSFLWMPSTMPHASIGEALDILQTQDRAIQAIPEIESVVGKLGRVESPLDPAPISMFETLVNYKAEYRKDADGKHVRQWRDHIQSPADIWTEIVAAAALPGVTSAPKLQPIETRLIMLQTGMRAPLGIKILGPDLQTIEETARQLEALIKQIPSIQAPSVFADRITGKPYLEIDIDRDAIARYGLTIADVQDIIEIAIGGKTATQTIEGRERYNIRVRYLRELRDSIEAIQAILVPTPSGSHIPLRELATTRYLRGPQNIKSENAQLVAYLTFDKHDSVSEVEAIENVQALLKAKEDDGSFVRPIGVELQYAGAYENQVRAKKALLLVIPLSLVIVFLILYFQFKKISLSLLVFSSIAFAWSGGFILIWLYGQSWFLNIDVFETNLRTLFQIETINLSTAVWVGFLALFGIATDDGVLMTTYLKQRFAKSPAKNKAQLIDQTIKAASRRARPALMTSATTLLALLPVLTSSGRGSDIMIPMAIPVFGGMLFALLTLFIVPVLFTLLHERSALRASQTPPSSPKSNRP